MDDEAFTIDTIAFPVSPTALDGFTIDDLAFPVFEGGTPVVITGTWADYAVTGTWGD